ncbi:MAG: cadherin-like beta sandwich domain-containing protein [Bacteroidales bacterium]|jgi:hypothetical protein|nr:cadherin-like beta sandwich domain-containing protein [Bacteroidales bacterium]
MKNVNAFLLCTTLFLWGWQMTAQAQGGATRNEAVAVAVDGTMPQAQILTDGAEQWFSFTGVAGSSYVVSNCGNASLDTEVSIYYESDGGSFAYNDDGCVSGYVYATYLAFTAGSNGTYYIQWRRYMGNSGTGSFDWTLTEVTDNRVCAYAEAVALNTPVTAVTEEYRWYKLAATAGESYGIAGSSSCYFDVYASCSSYPFSSGYDQLVFTAPATQDYYIRFYGYYGSTDWSVTAITDNRVCAYAEAVTLNTPVTAVTGENRWYKLAATAGESYGIAGSSCNFYMYASCGDSYPFRSDYEQLFFTAPTTQDYYIRFYANSGSTDWSVTAITDNRVCAYAEAVTLNTPVTADHANSRSLWYSVNVQAGKWYAVEGDNNSAITVFADCEEQYIAGSSDGTVWFRATGNGAALIRYTNYAGGNVTWKIREVAAADVPNTTCEAARAVTAGQVNILTPELNQFNQYVIPQSYYRLVVEAGHSYEIPAVANDFEVRAVVQTSCFGYYISEDFLSAGLTFTAQEYGEYIIWLYGPSSYPTNPSVNWQVNDLGISTKVCAGAITAALGTDIQTEILTSSSYGTVWYKFPVAAGVAYRILYESNTNYANPSVYEDCQDSSTGFSLSDTSYLFIAETSGYHYVEWEGEANAEIDWRVEAYTPPVQTNTSCAAAETVTAAADFMDPDVTHSAIAPAGQPLWYKFAATAGESYIIYKLEHMDAAVYTACNQSSPVASVSGSEGVSELAYHAAQSGTAYLRFNAEGINAFALLEAAPGIDCTTAIPVALDAAIQTAPPNSQWYSLTAEPGYLYTLTHTITSSPTSYFVFDGCGSNANQLGYGYDGDPLLFSVSSAQTCYIRYENYYGGTTEWSVSRTPVTGNTICSTAALAPLNTSVTTTVANGEIRWFSFFGEAGKAYEISDCGGASFDTELYYSSPCGNLSSQFSSNCNSGHYHQKETVAGENALIYFGWEGYVSSSGNITWTVTETVPDNQLCAFAASVNAGTPVHSILNSGVMRWYRFTPQQGKIYEISSSSSNYATTTYFEIFSGTCGDLSNVAYGSTSVLFQANEPGEYYIRFQGSYMASADYECIWQVREVSDNRFCDNATTVTAGVQVSNTHTAGSALWYVFTAPSAGQYDIAAPTGQLLSLWTGCESNTPVASGMGSLTFTATAGAAYYIQWTASANYEYSYTWSVSQHQAAALTALSVLNYPLSPTFSPQTDTYSVNVPNSASSVTVVAEALTGAAISGQTGAQSLTVGNNTLSVTVTTGAGNKTYHLNVHRAGVSANGNATLSALSAAPGSLAPSFSAAVTAYTVSVPHSTDGITIAATAAHTSATVNGTGQYALNVGSGNLFPVTVIAEDGTQLIYNIAVTRAEPPVTPEILNISVTPATVNLQKGDTRQFSATVTAAGDAAQTVSWSVSGKQSAGTAISASGLLVVASNETASTLTVRATSTFDNTKYGEATVAIPSTPEVLNVAVTPHPVSVQKGTTQQFIPNVTVTGGASEAVSWSVSGKQSAGTSINASGLLTVASDETATTLTVRATSAVNTGKYGEATVTVTSTPVTPTVVSVQVTPSLATIEKGATHQFVVNVAVTGGAAQTVNWSITGKNSPSTSISATGLLTVASDETATTLTVRATSTVNNTKYGIATVSVTAPLSPEIIAVTVTPASVNLEKSETKQFTANVVAIGGASEAVSWSVSGNSSTGTTINASGLLRLGDNETATILTVTATSVFDATKTGSATVTVGLTGVEDRLQKDIALYPNPFTGELHLTGAEGCTLKVFSASGLTVHSQKITSPDETIRTEDLPNGLYFFRLEKDGKSKTIKAVKQ